MIRLTDGPIGSDPNGYPIGPLSTKEEGRKMGERPKELAEDRVKAFLEAVAWQDGSDDINETNIISASWNEDGVKVDLELSDVREVVAELEAWRRVAQGLGNVVEAFRSRLNEDEVVELLSKQPRKIRKYDGVGKAVGGHVTVTIDPPVGGLRPFSQLHTHPFEGSAHHGTPCRRCGASYGSHLR